MATLSSKGRSQIKGSNFAIPSERRYPIHDKTHAINALQRSSGKPEAAQVRRAVERKYPTLRK